MKLLYCPCCADITKLGDHVHRYCGCGQSWGRYIDKLNAEIGGQGLPIGIENKSLVRAMEERARGGKREYMRFDAFFIKEPCSTVERV